MRTNLSYVSNTTMRVTYCLDYSQRGNVQDFKSVNFTFMLKLDPRTEGKKMINGTWTVFLNSKNSCRQSDVKIVVRI